MNQELNDFIDTLKKATVNSQQIININKVGKLQINQNGNIEIIEDGGKYFFGDSNNRMELNEAHWQQFLSYLNEKAHNGLKHFRFNYIDFDNPEKI